MSRVDVLAELFSRADVVTYEQAADALDLHPEHDIKAIRNAMAGVKKRLLADGGRVIRSMPTVGYRVVEANEHITLYRERKKRGTNQLLTGRDELAGTDLAALSPEARDAVMAESVAASRIIDFIVATDRRQQQTEQAVAEIKGVVSRNAEETAAIKERLTRLEQDE